MDADEAGEAGEINIDGQDGEEADEETEGKSKPPVDADERGWTSGAESEISHRGTERTEGEGREPGEINIDGQDGEDAGAEGEAGEEASRR